MNLCKNCKYNKRYWLTPFSRKFDMCVSPNLGSVTNYTTGKITINANYCDIIRSLEYQGFCAPEGEWFEPK